MNKCQELAMHDLIATLLHLDGDHVIDAYQNATRPTLPYASLSYRSTQDESMVEIGSTDSDGSRNIVSRHTEILEVQVFGGYPDCSPENMITNMIIGMKLDAASAIFRENGFCVFDSGPVSTFSAVLNKALYEKRAFVDLHVRYNSIITDTTGGRIEKVQIASGMGTLPDDTIIIESEV